MEKIFNIKLDTIDLDSFRQLIFNFGGKKLGYCSFTWTRLTQYSMLLQAINKISPKDFVNWYSKGYNFEKYNDYLRMRAKLKLLAQETNDSSLFNEQAYPEKVKKPEDVKRLHDIISKITFTIENKDKFERFDRACKIAKEYEFIDTDNIENGLQFVSPTAITDLVYEGTELNHCLKSPSWVDAIANASSVIMFIRQKIQPKVPYYTVEIDPLTHTIRQVHGQSNCAPTSSIVEFLLRVAKKKPNLIDKNSVKFQYGALCAPSRH